MISQLSRATSRRLCSTVSLFSICRCFGVDRLGLFRAHRCLAAVFLAATCLFGCAPAMTAQQQLPLGDDVAHPMPGTGHDYIHALAETVNPANGTVNLKLNMPTPKERGLSLPFAITYNSGEVFHFSQSLTDCGGLDSSQCPSGAKTDRTFVGWGDTIPYAVFSTTKLHLPPPHFQGGSGNSCTVSTSYNFYEVTGGGHALGLAFISPSTDGSDACADSLPFAASSGGGDSQVRSSSSYCNGVDSESSDCFDGKPAFKVTDAEGTVYSFLAGGNVSGPAFQFPHIEDRNGNGIGVSGCVYCTNVPLTVTDSLGRQLINISYKGWQPTGYTVGGLSYTPVYTTTSAHWSANPIQINPGTDPDVACNANFEVTGTETPAIGSLQLPNGKQYTFKYDPVWGLLSEVDYPDGGWVRYTWKLSDTRSTLASFDGLYPPSYTNSVAAGACNYRYQTPVVETRTVGYAPGSPAALTQTFAYVTAWDERNPFTWDTKTTTVTDVTPFSVHSGV